MGSGKVEKKVLVAMSGGVDSTVAAYLLKKAGFYTVGVTMCLGISESKDDSKIRCCGREAIEDARQVCAKLKIPHYVLDFSEQMERDVINNFIDEYRKGLTPNPCVRCNQYLKFGRLLSYARGLGFDLLATGHYAKIDTFKGKPVLRRPKDEKKDQTYFLYCINKDDLPFVTFPLADYTKEQVRLIAKDTKLPVAEKPQSQDICFIPEEDYKKFVIERIGSVKPGDIIDTKNNILGTHNGIINYTIGQRQGLGIAAKRPLYVLALNADKNEVIVGEKKDLLSRELIAKDVNQLSEKFPHMCFAKIRYAHKGMFCRVNFIEKGKIHVCFEQPQEAVTPGQSVVFYDKQERVLAGGIIESVAKSK